MENNDNENSHHRAKTSHQLNRLFSPLTTKATSTMRSPSHMLQAGHGIPRSNSMEDIILMQSIAGNRPQTVIPNDERTHFALHRDACSLPPGGFRPRPSSRGVFNSSSKTCVNMRIRGSICKAEYYEYPRSDFPVVKSKARNKKAARSQKRISQKKEEKSKPTTDKLQRTSSDVAASFQKGKPCQIRDLGHFVSGCLFRPAIVHHIRMSGWLDVSSSW